MLKKFNFKKKPSQIQNAAIKFIPVEQINLKSNHPFKVENQQSPQNISRDILRKLLKFIADPQAKKSKQLNLLTALISWWIKCKVKNSNKKIDYIKLKEATKSIFIQCLDSILIYIVNTDLKGKFIDFGREILLLDFKNLMLIVTTLPKTFRSILAFLTDEEFEDWLYKYSLADKLAELPEIKKRQLRLLKQK